MRLFSWVRWAGCTFLSACAIAAVAAAESVSETGGPSVTFVSGTTVGSQGFADLGSPSANTGNINTGTSFTLGNLFSTGASAGYFTGLPTQILGPISFQPSNPTSLAFGNSVLGNFVSTSIIEQTNSAGERSFVAVGDYTGGTFGGLTTPHPAPSSFTMSFTQTPAGTGAISASASLVIPSVFQPPTPPTPPSPSPVTVAVFSGTQTQQQAGYATLTGSSPLVKSGGGTLVLNRANTLTGSVTIAEGTLQIGDSGTSGSLGTGQVVNNGTLAFCRSDDITIMNSISGSGGLVQAGPGLLVLTASHSYSGPTSVRAGSLVLRNGNAIASSPSLKVAPGAAIFVAEGCYAVPSGQTVSGGGSFAGSMTLGSGATIAPGMSPGTLSVAGSVELGSGANYNWQMLSATGTAGGSSSWDKLDVQGAISITATPADPLKLNLWTLSGILPDTSGSAASFNPKVNYTWKIASAAGGISGFAADKILISTSAANGTAGFTNSLGVGTLSLVQSGNDLNLVFTSNHAGITVASGTQTQSSAGYGSFAAIRSVEKAGAGTLVLDQAGSLVGDMSVLGGVLRVASPSALRSSTVSTLVGGTVVLSPGLQATVGRLVSGAGGVVDVGSGLLTVATGLSPADLRAGLVAGRGDGSWNGASGIMSSVAAGSDGSRTVGWIDNGDGSLSVGFAAPGDANLDWQLDILDVADLVGSRKFNKGIAATWSEGDFNYDGVVDIQDLGDFASTGLYGGKPYNVPSNAVAAVPEPATQSQGLAALALGSWLLLRRRRG